MDNLIAVCGYNCSNCPIYKATINKDYESIKKILNITNDNESTLECLGCNSDKVNQKCCKNCYIKTCASRQKIDSCALCINFPCEYISKNISKESMDKLIIIQKEGKK